MHCEGWKEWSVYQRGWSSGWNVRAPGEKENSWKASAGNAAFREWRIWSYLRADITLQLEQLSQERRTTVHMSRTPNRTTEPWTRNLQDTNLSLLSKIWTCWTGKTSNKTHLSRFHSGNASSKCRLFFFYWSRSLQNTFTSKTQQPIISFEWNVPIYRHTLDVWFFILVEALRYNY